MIKAKPEFKGYNVAKKINGNPKEDIICENIPRQSLELPKSEIEIFFTYDDFKINERFNPSLNSVKKKMIKHKSMTGWNMNKKETGIWKYYRYACPTCGVNEDYDRWKWGLVDRWMWGIVGFIIGMLMMIIIFYFIGGMKSLFMV